MRPSLAMLLAVLPAFSETLLLKNFTLIDGTGRAPLANAALLIVDGKITAVGALATVHAPAGAQTADLGGSYVMPGIINLHGHPGNVVDLKQDAKNFTRENVERDLKTYASYGVTTVLSMGTDQDLMFQIRAEQHATRPRMTRVYTAGQGFIFKNGYGGLKGVTFELDSPAGVSADIQKLADKHVDIVKMWVDDHLGRNPKMPFDISKAIIDNAHQHGLRVAAHEFYLADAKQLVNGGLDSLAHSIRDKLVDQELIDSMKQHGAWLQSATLTREKSVFIYASAPPFLKDPFFTRGVSAKTLEILGSPEYQQQKAADPDTPRFPAFLEIAKKNLKTLADAGVRYGFGTDSGPPGRFPGYFEHWEMELMVDAGLTPMQVLTAATKSAAEFLKADDLGTLEPNKWADLIVLERNPVADIRNTRTIRAVYLAGNQVK